MTDFSSIDRLMEFGLGLGIARQMMDTMNHCMANTMAPGVSCVPPQMLDTSTRSYYAVVDEKVAGPFSETELGSLIGRGKVSEQTFVWHRGLPGWRQASDIPEVFKQILLSR